MLSLSAVFVAVCMVLIAASGGAVFYLLLGFSGAESAIVAVAALTGLALYNAVSTRLRDRSDVGEQIADLSRGTADLARQVAEFSRRLASVESDRGRSAPTNAAAPALATEPSELGIVVKELAETVALHQTALANLTAPAKGSHMASHAASHAAPAIVPAEATAAEEAPAPAPEKIEAPLLPATAASGPFKGMER